MTSTKTEQLQVRLTPEQKSAIKRLATASGVDVSSYVLCRVLPQTRQRFEDLLQLLAEPSERRFALAELNDLLTGMAALELRDALERMDVRSLPPLDQNYVAAMVEEAAHRKGVGPPRWVRDVAPLDRPHFTTPLRTLRLHLLRESPVPFRRRNVFVDSSLGARV